MPHWRAVGTLPNILSSSRFVLAAGFAVVDSTGARVGLIGAAAATDFLDGWVARRTHATSRFVSTISIVDYGVALWRARLR